MYLKNRIAILVRSPFIGLLLLVAQEFIPEKRIAAAAHKKDCSSSGSTSLFSKNLAFFASWRFNRFYSLLITRYSSFSRYNRKP
jgi:hypothetical protein